MQEYSLAFLYRKPNYVESGPERVASAVVE